MSFCGRYMGQVLDQRKHVEALLLLVLIGPPSVLRRICAQYLGRPSFGARAEMKGSSEQSSTVGKLSALVETCARLVCFGFREETFLLVPELSAGRGWAGSSARKANGEPAARSREIC